MSENTEEMMKVKAEEWLELSKNIYKVTDENAVNIRKTLSEIVSAKEKTSDKKTLSYLNCAHNFCQKALSAYDALLKTKKDLEETLEKKREEKKALIEKTKEALKERLDKAKKSLIQKEVEKELMKEEVKEKVEEVKKKRGRPPKE